jgi:aminoglycoside/choline kinase family phosphotransferase/dTDP-glucose pyrophosphorylase
MKALVLAAGMGTRLLPYTRFTPKPLFTLAGRPLLAHHIEQLRAGGCEAVVVNTHHLHAAVEAFVRSGRFGIPVHTRHEPQLLGTGGAIGNLRDFWNERPFFVVNADIHHAVDLRAVYAAHAASTAAATLVLVDDPEFNTVSIDRDGRIRAFARSRADAPAGALTFTGIQVLDPVVLDYLPDGGPGDSIAAFRAMLADGRRLNALVTRRPWLDLGTPDRYRRAARDACATAAWITAFDRLPGRPPTWEPLEGGGSDREWFRIRGPEGTLVAVDHGLRTDTRTAEVDAFADIGAHLKRRGVAVPAQYAADRFAGIVVVEDLGSTHLHAVVGSAPDRDTVLAIYRTVIDELVRLATEGVRGFDPGWTWQSPRYDRGVVLERECRYFCERFLADYAGVRTTFADLSDEFGRLADGIEEDAVGGFLHRDVQSRNIMLKGYRPHFIDFQGGRLGPVQYDLASLLIDPYVGLSSDEQERLYAHALARFSRVLPIDPVGFRRGYDFCALSRNLQALGAFAFLSRVKRKPQFEAYIPAALHGLAARMEIFAPPGFPKLKAAVAEARSKLGVTSSE